MDQNLQKIPKHHVKQQVCANRPAYREGRVPKGVKVYTVNNESRYILIQGVPLVGAMKELIQLCTSFGEVEEHNTLDEYPCEDKYTEVYLIKYKKIQSARYAKRKLDDYSFFGGTLHVCYAPEYESVADTRQKLQDRRRNIAAKIRKYESEKLQAQALMQESLHEEDTAPTSTCQPISNSDYETQQSHSINDMTLSLCGSNNTDYRVPPTNLQLVSPEQSDDSFSHNTPPITFELPLPPKPSLLKHSGSRQQYEYSRVPSKHSTLPTGFDGRLNKSNELEFQNPTVIYPSTSRNVQENPTLKGSQTIICKDYKSTKTTLKFVPRQALAKTMKDSKSKPSKDDNEELRKNAFLLGDKQGPADLPERKKRPSASNPALSASYTDTIKTIRSKISKVITDNTLKLPK